MNGEDRLKNRVRQYKVSFGLPEEMFYKYRLSKFVQLPGNIEAFEAACGYLGCDTNLKFPDEFCADFDEEQDWQAAQPEYHHFITFVGQCGRGKTHLALGTGILFIEKGCLYTLYYQVPDLLAQMRAGFENETTQGLSYEQIIRRCQDADVLILDDLGMEKTTPWAAEQLDSLIDFRYTRNCLTIFTTNLAPNELSPRIASRIKEGDVFTLTCGDYREELAKQRRARNVELEKAVKQ